MFPAPTSSRRTRLPPKAVVAVAALPLILGIVDAIQDAVFGLPSGIRLSPRMVPGVLTFYLMLAVLTPVVHRIVGWSLERSGSALRLIGHNLVVLPVFVVLHLAATMVIQRQIVPHEPDLRTHFTNMIRIFSMGSAVWYVVIAASLHALLYNLRSQDNELAAARLAAHLAEARLSALGAQLGSHFLFNTLSTIGALAERGEAGKVTEVVHDLSDLLRELRQEGGSTTSVAHEERLLAKYLRILHLRFGSRLSASVDIEARVRHAEIPILTLQVLAENAMKHGYGTQTTDLQVEVRVERAQDQTRICVSDSGPGFPAKALRSGGGLSNLKARLGALYQQDFSLETSTSSLGGARVEIWIPYRPAAAPRSTIQLIEHAWRHQG